MADEDLGARVRRLRGTGGLTRVELAQWMRALGARSAPSDIARYEVHLYVPKLRTFAVLARALGVSMETLLYGEDEAERLARERGGAGDRPSDGAG